MTEALDRSEKGAFHTITFRYGNPAKSVVYTNADTDNLFGGAEISVPKMEFEVPENTGTLERKLLSIKVELNDDTRPFLDALTRGTPFAPVSVELRERIDPTFPSDSARNLVLFSGDIDRTLRNFNGRNDLVKIECTNFKSRLETPMAFPCNHHCGWRLNGPGCNESTHGPVGYTTAARTVSVIDGKLVTVTGSTVLTGTKSWVRGFAEFDGLTIGIMQHDPVGAPQDFILVTQPPEEWLGQAVTFSPGCSKLIDDPTGCRDAWDNEEGFGGSGFAIPPYNPIVENPQ